MASEDNVGTDSWDNFMQEYLKPKHFITWPGKVFVKKVNGSVDNENKHHLTLEVHTATGRFLWEPNKTNMGILRDLKILKPMDLKDKNIYFNKIQVRNPATKQMVDGLEVYKVE